MQPLSFLFDKFLIDIVGCTRSLMDFINAYEEHKTTPEHRDAVQRSQKQQESQKRLSNEIWWAQYDYTKGKSLAAQVNDNMINADDLTFID